MRGAEPDGYWYVVLCTYSTKVILIKGSQQQDLYIVRIIESVDSISRDGSDCP